VFQFDNPIVKPSGAACTPSDDAPGINGGVAVTPRQRIEIARQVDSRESLNIIGTDSWVSNRDLLVHLPFKPRRRAVEASQVSAHTARSHCIFYNMI
jgi:hypothetical protein